MTTSNRDLAVRWFEEVWNQHRTEAIDELCAPHAIGHMEGKDHGTIDDFRQMREQLLTIFPDIRIVVEDACGDERAAVVRWRAEAIHSGQIAGLQPTGKGITFSGMTWMTFKDGKIVEAWDRWNRDGLMQQLTSA